MLDSIQQHILAKLNMTELPENVPANATIPAELLASYFAHLQSQEQDAGGPQECSEDETTHFSRHSKLYYPDHYAPAEPNSHNFQLYSGDDGKGEEVKDPKNSNSDVKPSSKGTKKESSVSPVLYNLRFDEFDFSDSDRMWSVKLQLYKRKAPVDVTSKRGMNPIEAVKVFRVLKTYAYGRSTKRYVLLASKNVPSDDEGYVSFNITSGVKNWVGEDSILELAVQIDTPQRVDTGLSLPPAITFDVPSHRKGEHNARLVVERLNEIERTGSNRLHDDLYRRRKRQTVQGVNSEYCFNNPSESNCCIKNLTVDFHEDLNWNWIIYPKRFQPNFCKGQCTKRWPSATQSTTFLMQLRESNPTAAPEPCCVAHKTRPLTVFMWLKGEVVLNEFPDMIVDSCICR